MFLVAVLLARSMIQRVRPMIQRLRCRKENGGPLPETHMVTNFLFTYFESFFLVVLANAINFAFSTYPHPTLDAKSLLAFPFILSSGSTANSAYTDILVISVVATVVWGFGFFVVLLLIVNELRIIIQNGTVAQNRTFIKHVIIIFIRYRDEYYYWPLVTLVQKVFFNLAMVFHDIPEHQLLHMVFVTLIFLLITMKCHPYRSPDYYDIDVNIQCFFILLIVLVMFTRYSTSAPTQPANVLQFIYVIVWLVIILMYILKKLTFITYRRFKCFSILKSSQAPTEKELLDLQAILRARNCEQPPEDRMKLVCKQLRKCEEWVDLELRPHSDRMDNKLPILIQMMDDARAIFTPISAEASLDRPVNIAPARSESKIKGQLDDDSPITPILPRLLSSSADANKNKVSPMEMEASGKNVASVDAEDRDDRPMAEEEKHSDDAKTQESGATL
eukprot:GEMP01034317.1.p1 GENE.GEMP01034317.1~~GEMP01034317.1.p1  ORF type:complete len:446 (+),score=61.77 GEMP01034317.1:88-1425(+)